MSNTDSESLFHNGGPESTRPHQALAKADPAPSTSVGVATLRALERTDIPWLYGLETESRVIRRFRLAGTTPPPSVYERTIQNETFIQYVVLHAASLRRIGVVYAYNPNLASGTTWIAMMCDPDYTPARHFMHGVFGFVDLLFRHYNMRKIFGAVPSYNLEQFAHMGPLDDALLSPSERSELVDISSLFEIEAVLTNHRFFDGKKWDLYIGAVSRPVWEFYRPRLIEQLERDVAHRL